MLDEIKKTIRTINDFPKKGIAYKDITTALKNADTLKNIIDLMAERFAGQKIDIVTGIESRGFIFASMLAIKLGAGFVPIRKVGKLPSKTVKISYELEYGTDTIEMHSDAIEKGKNVLLVDDLLATGGTAKAACTLLKQCGANLISAVFFIELTKLNGKQKLLPETNVFSLIEF